MDWKSFTSGYVAGGGFNGVGDKQDSDTLGCIFGSVIGIGVIFGIIYALFKILSFFFHAVGELLFGLWSIPSFVYENVLPLRYILYPTTFDLFHEFNMGPYITLLILLGVLSGILLIYIITRKIEKAMFLKKGKRKPNEFKQILNVFIIFFTVVNLYLLIIRIFYYLVKSIFIFIGSLV